MLNGSRLYYQTITCEKNSSFCSVLQGNPAVASPKEQLYEQMTSNPAFTEREIYKKPTLISYNLARNKKSLVTYYTLRNLYVCVWLVNTLTSTPPIGSSNNNLHVISSLYLRTVGKEFIFQFSRRSWGRNARDEPLRTSAWDATTVQNYFFNLSPYLYSLKE